LLETTLEDTNRRWADLVARRLDERPATRRRPQVAVLNQGTGCGRLLRDFCSPSAPSRFGRDVVEVTGAMHVVLAVGFVDTFLPTAAGTPDDLSLW
jgi:hypothetical protein